MCCVYDIICLTYSSKRNYVLYRCSSVVLWRHYITYWCAAGVVNRWPVVGQRNTRKDTRNSENMFPSIPTNKTIWDMCSCLNGIKMWIDCYCHICSVQFIMIIFNRSVAEYRCLPLRHPRCTTCHRSTDVHVTDLHVTDLHVTDLHTVCYSMHCTVLSFDLENVKC
jgi:hypothetical protein